MDQAKVRTDNGLERAEPALDGQPGTDGRVPERPALAPSVELSGQMEESGFTDQQWLVLRDGQFVQVTELLYRLLEQVNGERTLDDIAAGVSEATNRRVSVDNVRQLLDRKLIPLGLVAAADGSVAGMVGKARSPLRINMKTSVIPPALIDPITGVLQNLYRPPILIALLLAAGLAQGWLFLVHGIAHSVYQVVYQPGYMLALMALVIIATAFHEFGHASALRYGGGKVRGMGVGLYLVYPAFYTDVTDNYRLDRWARVRTDLGGFYFNLIFALVMLGLYAVTKLEFLLLAVVFVDLEIINQTLPFVRLDGYWALADLTGLPDFFSQIIPFFRTVLPLPLWKNGPKLPPLKPWVKAVFALYILVTVPLLVFLFLLMYESAPRVVATALDSLQRQVHALAASLGSGDVLGMIAAAIEIVLLALPTIGLFVVLFKVGRMLARGLWNWSKPTPLRRATGAAVAAGAVTMTALAWSPYLPFLGSNRTPLHSPVTFRPIGPMETGTLGDSLRSLPLLGELTNAAVPPAKHAAVPEVMRRFPVVGGVVNVVAPESGAPPIIGGARNLPVVGGLVEQVAPANGHGGLFEAVRRVPIIGGAVDLVTRSPGGASHPSGSTSHRTGTAGTSGVPTRGSSSGASSTRGSSSGASSTTGAVPRGSRSVQGAPPSAAVPTAEAQLTAGAGAIQTATTALTAGVPNVQTPEAQLTAAAGLVATPIAQLTAAAGVVQTPLAAVTSVSGVAKTPVAAITAVGGVVKTPLAAVTSVGGVVKTPLAAVTSVGGVVKTPVAAVTAASGVVKTPAAAVTAASNVVKTPVAAATAAPGVVKTTTSGLPKAPVPVPTVVP